VLWGKNFTHFIEKLLGTFPLYVDEQGVSLEYERDKSVTARVEQ